MKKYIVEHKEDPHSEMAAVEIVVCIPEVFCKFILCNKIEVNQEVPRLHIFHTYEREFFWRAPISPFTTFVQPFVECPSISRAALWT